MIDVNLSYRLTLPASPIDLEQTLFCGQTFCWRKESDGFIGWIHGNPVHLHREEDVLVVQSPQPIRAADIQRYFYLTPEWDDLLTQISGDEYVRLALREYPGLRCIQEDWWECTANFICSALKQISQIQQINHSLRSEFGENLPGFPIHAFPTFQQLARVSEKDLRACKLGFRAKHLHRAARQLADGMMDFSTLSGMDTSQAAKELQKLDGIGEKVAHCILLYAGGRFDAFPIDVWVSRLLQKLYRHKKRKRPELTRQWALKKFGPHCGLSQLYLFHWFRNGGSTESIFSLASKNST